jgi:hypothetical protein
MSTQVRDYLDEMRICRTALLNLPQLSQEF